jgi:hypothetical protein
MRLSRMAAVLVVVVTSASARADEAERCAEQAEQAPVLRDKGQLVGALELLESCAQDACPRVVRDDCRAALVDLRDRIPKLTIHVRDPQGLDVADARVTLDDRPLTTQAYAQGVPLDPRAHVVRVVRPPFRPVEQSVVIAATDRARNVEIVLTSPPPVVVVEATRNRTAAVAVGAFGLAFVATFGVIGTWTLVDFENLQTACRTSCTGSAIDDAHNRGYIADAFLGAGILTLAIATALWFTAPLRHAH